MTRRRLCVLHTWGSVPCCSHQRCLPRLSCCDRSVPFAVLFCFLHQVMFKLGFRCHCAVFVAPSPRPMSLSTMCGMARGSGRKCSLYLFWCCPDWVSTAICFIVPSQQSSCDVAAMRGMVLVYICLYCHGSQVNFGVCVLLGFVLVIVVK